MLSLPRLQLFTLILAFLPRCACIVAADNRPFNILFIAVDDLRPALGCYGDAIAVSPHIDDLAAQGVVFDRAYCQQAVCSPSRLSLLTGRRPDTIHVWDLKAHFRDTLPDIVTLPQQFRLHGYQTQSIGKIWHGSGKPSQDPPSWTLPPQFDQVRDPALRYSLPENLAASGLKRSAAESADVPDDSYVDGQVCNAAINALVALEKSRQPFFLAVGFRKPHLPFCAPQKYWDLYDPKDIPAIENPTHPAAAPELAVRSWTELEGYSDIPADARLTAEQLQHLRHGYYACISYVDAQIGRIMAQLRSLQLAEKTIVVLWGDHGFHLGEQGLWTKANNYELSTRVPLILSVPGSAASGIHTNALVELVDIYPTLLELCAMPVSDDLEGTSLTPLLSRPDRPWKTAAFSQFPRAASGSRHQGRGEIMGYTIRTQNHRYVEWRSDRSGAVVARELYDHTLDPLESRNIAGHTEQQLLLADLAEQLHRGWHAARPPEQAAAP